ncbi:MAG: D-aminoacyl-tRNA deacylase [Armatimonadota bacterium]
MRAVVQRVSSASVDIDGRQVARIESGLLALVGFGEGDGKKDIHWMANKLSGLRIFEDADGKMNLSVLDTGGSILVVPNFTLYGDCQKGRRPSFSSAAAPEKARELFDRLVGLLKECGVPTPKGTFGAHMHVELTNDGPVTLIIESPQ